MTPAHPWVLLVVVGVPFVVAVAILWRLRRR